MIKPIFCTVAVAAMAVTLVACDKLGLGPQPAPTTNAAAPAVAPASAGATSAGAAPSVTPAREAPGGRAYQTVVIPGSASASTGVFRVNIATGQVANGWGSATSMQPIADLPIPVGQYHLVGWSQPAAADGSVSWGLVRVDAVSGRVWTLNGDRPYNWIEMVAPQ